MPNGDIEDPQVKLAQVVAEANRPPEPSKWVQVCQMVFAGLLFLGALLIAVVLILHGPPAPKTPEGEGGSGASATTGVADHIQTRAGLLTSTGEEGTEGEQETEDGSDDEGDENNEEGEEASLASLNEQAPWAFAIVALLVGAFLATGKTLNFSAGKGVVQQEQEGEGG